MELIDLKVFAAVVEQGTATKAAKTLGMTQPGVSKHLSRLEENIGGKLFKRAGKYLVINEYGEFLYERVKKILGAVEDLSDCSYGALMPAGSLKFGLTDAATMVVTPPSIIEFRKRFPRIQISLDVDSSTHIEEGVLNGHYDMGVVTAAIKTHPLLEQETLYEDFIDAVVSQDHILAKKKRVTLEDITEYTLIISPRRRRTRLILEDAFKAHGIKIKDVIEVYIHTTAVRLAEAGLGVALLPRAFISRDVPQSRCVHVPIAGNPIKRTMCIIRRKDSEPTEAAIFFYSIILKKSRSVAMP
jgi:DNA-binding transcriptional LysR family regulator